MDLCRNASRKVLAIGRRHGCRGTAVDSPSEVTCAGPWGSSVAHWWQPAAQPLRAGAHSEAALHPLRNVLDDQLLGIEVVHSVPCTFPPGHTWGQVVGLRGGTPGTMLNSPPSSSSLGQTSAQLFGVEKILTVLAAADAADDDEARLVRSGKPAGLGRLPLSRLGVVTSMGSSLCSLRTSMGSLRLSSFSTSAKLSTFSS
eukprot:CAMPEP_0180832972 /NCGR_PEP_ID=MMETSP1038_2-20121128/77114_1 /TAXON_ID=632150 /ORGANISM="Azadinium spinosum, Strain 3D9" /LENGTH=199 /DNA_ID=CAMNT_0022876187 /DNA_START=150 /DNA_END=747 /DNA_ORIENTATION=-